MTLARFVLCYLTIAALCFWWWDRAVLKPTFKAKSALPLPKMLAVSVALQLVSARVALGFVMLLWPIGMPVFLLLRWVAGRILDRAVEQEDVVEAVFCEDCQKPCPFCERAIDSDRGPMHDITMQEERFERFHICERCIEEDILRRIEQNEIDITVDIHTEEQSEA